MALFLENGGAPMRMGAEQKPVKKRGIERIAGMFDRKCEKRYCAVCDCRYAGERVSFGLDVHGMVVPRKADAANLGYFVLTGKGGAKRYLRCMSFAGGRIGVVADGSGNGGYEVVGSRAADDVAFFVGVRNFDEVVPLLAVEFQRFPAFAVDVVAVVAEKTVTAEEDDFFFIVSGGMRRIPAGRRI